MDAPSTIVFIQGSPVLEPIQRAKSCEEVAPRTSLFLRDALEHAERHERMRVGVRQVRTRCACIEYLC